MNKQPSRTTIVVGGAVAAAVLAFLLWPTVHRTLEWGVDNRWSRLGAALIGAAAFLLIAWLVYSVAQKTLWELLELLVVPLAIAVIGFWFTTQQDAWQQQIEDRRAQQAQKIENQRAEAERELAEQRAQDEALQAYLGQMSALLTDKDLRGSRLGSEVRTLARARTLAILDSSDPDHKTRVMRFLVEAELIQGETRPCKEGAGVCGIAKDPIIDLNGAELSGVDLSADPAIAPEGVSGTFYPSDLRAANLDYADLSHADLSWAWLDATSLYGANLTCADLSTAHLGKTDLASANLTRAKGLVEIKSEGYLENPAFRIDGAIMPNGQRHAEWVKSNDTQEYEAWLKSNDWETHCSGAE